jgi:hypothetical protein
MPHPTTRRALPLALVALAALTAGGCKPVARAVAQRAASRAVLQQIRERQQQGTAARFRPGARTLPRRLAVRGR